MIASTILWVMILINANGHIAFQEFNYKDHCEAASALIMRTYVYSKPTIFCVQK